LFAVGKLAIPDITTYLGFCPRCGMGKISAHFLLFFC